MYAMILPVILFFSTPTNFVVLFEFIVFFVVVQGFQRKISSKENEAAPAADETMEISAGKEEIERSLNVEPRAVKESSK